MRCIACDCNLNDKESTRKSPVTGEYYDLCDHCMTEADLMFVEGYDDGLDVEEENECLPLP